MGRRPWAALGLYAGALPASIARVATARLAAELPDGIKDTHGLVSGQLGPFHQFDGCLPERGGTASGVEGVTISGEGGRLIGLAADHARRSKRGFGGEPIAAIIMFTLRPFQARA